MTSFRRLSKLLNTSKLNLSSTSNICIFRLFSYDSTKFLRQFDQNQIHVFRTVRTGNTRGPSSTEPPPEGEQPKDENPFGKSNVPPNLNKIDPSSLKKLMIFMLGVICTSFGLSFLPLEKMITHSNPALAKALEAEPMGFDEFLNHILPTGEVARVIYFPNKQRALALLQPNTLINGKSYSNAAIVVKTERANPGQPDPLTLGIRETEERLGLPLREGIPISHNNIFRGALFFRTMEFMAAFAFTGFLASQYAEIIRVHQKRAEDGAKSAGKK